MRVVAILAVYNEERFIAACLEHLIRHGIDIYLIDNASTDETVAIAERYLDRGLIGMESFPRHGQYSWRPILERKAQLAATLDADWLMHVDADEMRLPPSRFNCSLSDALAQVDKQGFNAVNFLEFTFVPTREAPDHDHDDFQATMRWYYPYMPLELPTQVKAWKQQAGPMELAWSAGHQVRFPGIRVYPEWFPMRHYMFLSVGHAICKYIERRYDPSEIDAGWHRARAGLRAETITLPHQSELRRYLSDDQLDASNPRTQHWLFASSGIQAAEGRDGE